jgi:hypothetical protein
MGGDPDLKEERWSQVRKMGEREGQGTSPGSVLVNSQPTTSFLSHGCLGVETGRIHVESDSNNTFYHIFTRIRIQIRIFSNTNTKQMSRIQKHI